MFKRLAVFLGAVAGGLLLYIKSMQLSKVKREKKRQAANFDARRKADKALIEGITNESRRDTKRNHFRNK